MGNIQGGRLKATEEKIFPISRAVNSVCKHSIRSEAPVVPEPRVLKQRLDGPSALLRSLFIDLRLDKMIRNEGHR